MAKYRNDDEVLDDTPDDAEIDDTPMTPQQTSAGEDALFDDTPDDAMTDEPNKGNDLLKKLQQKSLTTDDDPIFDDTPDDAMADPFTKKALAYKALTKPAAAAKEQMADVPPAPVPQEPLAPASDHLGELIQAYRDSKKKQEDAINSAKMSDAIQGITNIFTTAGKMKNWREPTALDTALKLQDKTADQAYLQALKEAHQAPKTSDKWASAKGEPVVETAQGFRNAVTGAIEKNLVPMENFSAATQSLIQSRADSADTKRIMAEGASSQREFNNMYKQDKMDQAKQDRRHKDAVALNDKLTAELKNGRSAFGRAANVLQSTEKLEGLVNGDRYDKLSNREIVELAKSLDNLLSGGSATVSGTEHLLPKTIRGDEAKVLEYVTNKVHSAGAGDFARQIMDTVAREKEIAKDQIYKTQKKVLGGSAHLQGTEEMRNILIGQDLPLDIFDRMADKNDKRQAQTTPSTERAPAAVAPTLAPTEEVRQASDGSQIVYDKVTKKPLRRL